MKMKTETYEELKKDLLELIDLAGVQLDVRKGRKRAMWDLLNVVNTDRAYQDKDHPCGRGTRPRFLAYTGRPYNWLYKEGLQDSHVETALMKIFWEVTNGKH